MLIPQPKTNTSKKQHNQKTVNKVKRISLNQLRNIFCDETTEIKSFVETSTPQPKRKTPRRTKQTHRCIDTTTPKNRESPNTLASKPNSVSIQEEPITRAIFHLENQDINTSTALSIKQLLNPMHLQQPYQNQYLVPNPCLQENHCNDLIPITSSYKSPYHSLTRSYTCKTFSAAENHQSLPVILDLENNNELANKPSVSIPSIDELRRNIYLKKCSLDYILNRQQPSIDLSTDMQLSASTPNYSLLPCSSGQELFSFSDNLSENISTSTNTDKEEEDYALNNISSYISDENGRMRPFERGSTTTKNDFLNQIKRRSPAYSNDPLDLLYYDKYMIIFK